MKKITYIKEWQTSNPNNYNIFKLIFLSEPIEMFPDDPDDDTTVVCKALKLNSTFTETFSANKQISLTVNPLEIDNLNPRWGYTEISKQEAFIEAL